jgi:hypothetical protein
LTFFLSSKLFYQLFDRQAQFFFFQRVTPSYAEPSFSMMHNFSSLFLFLFLFVSFNVAVDGKAAATTTKTPATVKPTEKPKNPLKTIAKAKIMGNPLTEQEWLNIVFGQLSPR